MDSKEDAKIERRPLALDCNNFQILHF